jgi:hypothetical protein
MPSLDASALSTDPEGLAYLRAVIGTSPAPARAAPPRCLCGDARMPTLVAAPAAARAPTGGARRGRPLLQGAL